MPPESTENKAEKTHQFLIELLKHSADGRIDWRAFIRDMDISTVNAAKKRFKRMMEPHGITERALTALSAKDGTPKKLATKKRPDSDAIGTDIESNKGSPTKKRKVAIVMDPVTISEAGEELEEAVEKSMATVRVRTG